MHTSSLRLALLLVLTAATPAYAAEEGGLLSIDTGLMIWTVIIFLVVLGLLGKFAFPHILGAVEAREARIRELLDSAARDRDEAHALLEKQREELEQARTRAQELFAENQAAGERAREELLAQTRREQEEMLERTHREIHLQMERAMDTVRKEAVDLAIAAAGRLVERDLDVEGNRRVVRDYLGQLEKSSGPAATAGA